MTLRNAMLTLLRWNRLTRSAGQCLYHEPDFTVLLNVAALYSFQSYRNRERFIYDIPLRQKWCMCDVCDERLSQFCCWSEKVAFDNEVLECMYLVIKFNLIVYSQSNILFLSFFLCSRCQSPWLRRENPSSQSRVRSPHTGVVVTVTVVWLYFLAQIWAFLR